MRYRLRLNKSIKNNFILLPQNSPLRQSLSNKGTYMSFETNNVTPIKLTPLGQQEDESHNFYFGYSGGTSSEENVVEISDSVGRLLGLNDNDLVQAAIEYSFEKLKQIELEPLTPDDFEIIEKNCSFIEEQLLN